MLTILVEITALIRSIGKGTERITPLYTSNSFPQLRGSIKLPA